jgi:SacI homology domain
MSSINNDNNTTRQEPAAAQTPDAAASTTTRKEAFRRFHAEISAPSRRAAAQRSSQTAAARTATRKTPPLRPPRPPPAPSSSPASSAAAAASAAANANAAVSTSTAPPPPPASLATEPTIEAYIGRLERFELFSTNQCYYIVGSNKLNTAYRIIKIDRTLIERAPEQHQSSAVNTQAATSFSSSSAAASPPSGGGGGSTHNNNIINMRVVGMSRGDSNISTNSGATIPGSASGGGGPNSGPNNSGSSDNNVHASEMAENSHTAKPTLRPLSDFLTEDPNVYTQEEIKDVLDMIHDGNRMTTNTNTRSGGGNSGMDRLMQDNSNSSNNNNSNSNIGSAGGLKPIVKAYGLVGFIRFLDCYYLTLITKRAKVGSIGCGCGVYTIKNTETIPLKPAERVSTELVDDLDPSSVLLSMWSKSFVVSCI